MQCLYSTTPDGPVTFACMCKSYYLQGLLAPWRKGGEGGREVREGGGMERETGKRVRGRKEV